MIKQNLNLKLSQKLSPQQIQLMKLIQLPTLAFEQKIKEELEENPALELGNDNLNDEYSSTENDYDDRDDYETIDTSDINIDEYLSNDETPDYKLYSNNYSDDDDNEYTAPIIAYESFHQNLLNQLSIYTLNAQDRDIAEFIVGSLDDMGYLRRSETEIVDDLAFTQAIYTDENKIKEILTEVIQELEPSGIGARDLQECLSLQLKHKTPTASILLAKDIVENNFDLFIKKHYDKLLQRYNISQEQLRNAIDDIERLNPKPGSAYSTNQRPTEHIIPDFSIKLIDGKLDISLNGKNAPELHISKDYQEMLEAYKLSTSKTSSQKDAVQFIKQKLDGAKWFIEAVKQRQDTLLSTMTAIVNYQKDYFTEGDDNKIKPMILKDIADITGLDISTVSRVANSKYVETPYGTKLIKDFFSEAMTKEQGEEISSIEVKNILKSIIEEENKKKPYSDDKLTEILKEKGYVIARRTVSKYRELLDIPVARLRKKI